MPTEACRDWRGDLGLEALGALDEPARTALLAHLDGCVDCRRALDELRSVANALDLADLTRIGDGADLAPPGELGDRILGRLQWERAAQKKRRRRWGYIASAIGTAAAVIVALVLALGSGGGGGAGGTVVALRSSEQGVRAQAVLYSQDTGTRVSLRVHGLDDHEFYWLWVTGSNGKRIAAGSFSPSKANENLTMSAALSRGATKRVWVTDEGNNVVLDGYVTSS
jgi:anti-sigma-K factor RskA